MVYRADLRMPSFWWFQAAGWCCFGLVSILLVLPYARRPWELGYQGMEGLFADQAVMCLGAFFASLALRPICRSLIHRSPSWISLQLRALGWSLLTGTSTALLISRLIIATPDPVELLEACVKATALLFLWCNLYFNIKQSQQLRPRESALATQRGAEPLEPPVGTYVSRFSVRTGSRVQIVLVEDVEWIAAAGDYSELHTRAGVHLLRETMKSLEERLDPAQFVRIHRSRIVSLRRVLELRSIENREYLVKLSDGSQHRCSRTYADRVSRWLRGT